MSVTSSCASFVNFLRMIVSSGEAMMRSTSDKLVPIVFAPMSRPISLAWRGNVAKISSSTSLPDIGER